MLHLEIGKWIKKERKNRGYTQEKFANLLGVSQGLISVWESNQSVPGYLRLKEISTALNTQIPFTIFGGVVMERLSLYQLPNADSIKTFDGKTYELKGFLGIEVTSGEVQHVSDLYYRTRSVVKDKKLVAKRKNVEDELKKVAGKKVKER